MVKVRGGQNDYNHPTFGTHENCVREDERKIHKIGKNNNKKKEMRDEDQDLSPSTLPFRFSR